MKRAIYILLVLLFSTAQLSRAQESWSVWDGTTTTKPAVNYANDAWIVNINSAAELAWVMKNMHGDFSTISDYGDKVYRDVNHCTFNLTINCDMTAVQWVSASTFSGIFDGNGHTIRIKLENTTENYQGLFKEIKPNGFYAAPGIVRNLRVDGRIACSRSRLVGGIAGQNSGTITNCWVSADVSSNWKESASSYTAKVGGIVGENSGTIEYCCVTGNVSNNDADVGGLVGYNNGGTVRHCIFYGTRSSTHSQDNIYVGDNDGSLSNTFDGFNQAEYDGADGNEMYRQAIKNPWRINVSSEGFGTVTVNSYGTYRGAAVTLTTSSAQGVQSIRITDSAGSNVSYTNYGGTYTFTMPNRSVTAKVIFNIGWPRAGSGTESDPYIISSADEWVEFASAVNSGSNFSGKFIKLTSDISVSKIVGIDTGHTFKGIFDGDGHTLTFTQSDFGENFVAPFRYTGSCTIKNLHTAGTISTKQQFAAGIISYISDSFSTVTIENCRSSVTLDGSLDWNNANGGLIAAISSICTVTITGCVFDGRFTGASSDHNGGFVGWVNPLTSLRIQNCLFAPSEINTENEACYTWARVYDGGPDPTVTGSYYTRPYNATSGGTQAYTITPGQYVTLDIADEATTSYSVSGITLYRAGMKFGNVLYAGASEVVHLTLGYNRPDYSSEGYTVSDGTLSGTGNPYTLTMPDANVTVNVSQQTLNELSSDGNGNYLIGSSDDWSTFCAQVENGNSYSGKSVKLTSDISVSRMAGASGKNFSGTFDGDGHTLTFTKGTAGSPFTEDYCAPFRYINSATIKNLIVGGDIYTFRHFAAGLVACPSGEVTITNCVVRTVIHSSLRGGGNKSGTHGGIVARGTTATALTLEGCVFAGRLFTTNGTIDCGGLIGWSAKKTITVVNSLYAPDPDINALPGERPITHAATFVYSDNVSVENDCLYTEPLGTAQGTKAYVFGSTPAFLGNLVKDYGLVKAYTGGILFDGKYYYFLHTVNLTANAGPDGYYWTSYYSASSYLADEKTVVYKAAVIDNTVELTEVPDREIPANEAVILKSTASSITLTSYPTTQTLEGNELKGGSEVTEGYDAYTLSRGEENAEPLGFYKFSGTLNPEKAHLEILKSAPNPHL